MPSLTAEKRSRRRKTTGTKTTHRRRKTTTARKTHRRRKSAGSDDQTLSYYVAQARRMGISLTTAEGKRRTKRGLKSAITRRKHKRSKTTTRRRKPSGEAPKRRRRRRRSA
jgi:hypothetical protein